MARPNSRRQYESPLVKRPSRFRLTGVIGAPRMLYHRFTFNRITNDDRIVEYLKLLKRVIQPENVNKDSELKAIMQSLIEIDLEKREVSLKIIHYAWKVMFRDMPLDSLQSISEYTLDNIRCRERYFIRATAIVRQSLAKIYGKYHGRFNDAILLLKAIPLNVTAFRFTTHFKIEIYLLIGGLFVNTDTPESGTRYLEMAKPLLDSLGFTNVKIAFCLNLARNMDVKGDYIISSRVFHQLINETILDINEAIEIRQSTIACSVLAPVGSWRNEFLEKLCVDHRYHKYVPMATIIKMKNMCEVILPADMESLDPVMKPHHKEKTEHGINRLEYATCEHNLQVLCKTNRSMEIGQLESELYVKPDIIEKIAEKMIAEKRLDATIDDGIICFKASETGEASAQAPVATGVDTDQTSK